MILLNPDDGLRCNVPNRRPSVKRRMGDEPFCGNKAQSLKPVTLTSSEVLHCARPILLCILYCEYLSLLQCFLTPIKILHICTADFSSQIYLIKD